MSWTEIKPLYDSNGDLLPSPPPNPTDAFLDWDDLTDEIRQHLEDVVLMFLGYTDIWVLASDESWSILDWTRGTGSDKRLAPMNGGNGDDFFYVSHISDLRTVINYLEDSFLENPSTWTMDPIAYKYDSGGTLQGSFDEANDEVFFRESREATDVLLKSPINFREQP